MSQNTNTNNTPDLVNTQVDANSHDVVINVARVLKDLREFFKNTLKDGTELEASSLTALKLHFAEVIKTIEIYEDWEQSSKGIVDDVVSTPRS